jgi:hypothetical protein
MRRFARRKYERRLRIIEFGRDRLHLRRCQALRIKDDRERIATEYLLGEDIDGNVTALQGGGIVRNFAPLSAHNKNNIHDVFWHR